MSNRFVSVCLSALALFAFAGVASAQTWSAEQKEVWAFEELQWKMAAAKDLGWIDTMVHPNITYWETGQPRPQQGISSLKRWNRYSNTTATALEQEILPISITITGNVAVVAYHYMVAREDYKKERETVTGQYLDILIKESGGWRFIAWSGGDIPKK